MGVSLVVHPAVRHVQETESLWSLEKELAFKRASLIVCQLIRAGYINGDVVSGVPVEKPKVEAA